MKRPGIVPLLIGLVLVVVLASVSQAQMADYEFNHRPRRTPTPTAAPVATTPPTSGPLAAPMLSSPPNGATVAGDVTFVWNPVPGAACYHLQAGSGPNHGAQYNIIDRWCVTGTSYTVTVTPGFIFYFPQLYWHVRARTTTGLDGVYGPWSETWKVVLANP